MPDSLNLNRLSAPADITIPGENTAIINKVKFEFEAPRSCWQCRLSITTKLANYDRLVCIPIYSNRETNHANGVSEYRDKRSPFCPLVEVV